MKIFKANKASAVVIIIVAVIVLAVIVGGSYLIIKKQLEQPEEEEGVIEQEEEGEFVAWEIYKSENLALEFEYPKDWKVEEAKNYFSTTGLVFENRVSIKQPENQISFAVNKTFGPDPSICFEFSNCPFCDPEPKEIIQIKVDDLDVYKCIYQSLSNLDIERIYLEFRRGFIYNEKQDTIEPVRYFIEGEYFSNLPEDEIDKLDSILDSIKFSSPELSREDIKNQICKNHPVLVGMGSHYRSVADKMFVEEEDALKMLTAEELQIKAYKSLCIKRYFIEKDIPNEVLNKLPESDLLTNTFANIKSWKKYSDKDLEIEFKYPLVWSVVKEYLEHLRSTKGKVGYIQSRVPYKDYPSGAGPLYIGINDGGPSEADWGIIDEIKTITVGGQKTLLVRGLMSPDNKLYYAIKISNESHDFYFKYVPSQQGSLNWTKEQHRLILATILSTFKFLE